MNTNLTIWAIINVSSANTLNSEKSKILLFRKGLMTEFLTDPNWNRKPYNIINVSQKLKIVSEELEKIGEKGENFGYKHFLCFPQCWKILPSGLSKVTVLWWRVKKRYINLFINIPSSEILQFPGVINFDIISSEDVNFHFHFLLLFRNNFFFNKHL